ncbi:spore germination protein D [Scopulibacillus darangshiensis]|uniref:Spore germination protein D n=1 Tax=Scopulibacillus darangshiensis TaxID=442528 RepID=A0A4R2NQT8_9BACL|nr:spore germination lipoprotein GerD [Scopulibacillus darangshiensis]TCP24200.1 spore germination protein D [Scopulibacillus darangshiensis]
MKKAIPFIIFSFILLLSGCSSGQQQSGQPDYQETKKMFIDMLKTDEGKKAVQDIMKDEKVKEQIVLNNDFVKKTITDALTSDKGKKYLESLFSDPKFSNKVAKVMQKNNEKMLKSLMKDPEYQAMMMDIFKAPKMEKEYLDLMKTKPFREQMQKVIMDTISSPLFATQLEDAVKKAVKEEMKKGGGQQQQQKQQGGQ